MTTFRIRQCRREDLAAVHALEVAAFGEMGALPLLALVQYFDLFSRTFFVAVSQERLVGFSIVGTSVSISRAAWLLDIAVSASHQKLGIARELLQASRDAVRDLGVAMLYATVAPGNAASLALFVNHGFVVERYEPDYLGPNGARLLLCLNLLS